MLQTFLELVPGYRTALADGTLVPDSPKHMATEEVYHALPGSRLTLCGEEYLFAVALYSLKRDEQYIYSYAYQREENWATYLGNLKPQDYTFEDYIFEQECFFRVCVRRRDGADLTEEDTDRADSLLSFTGEEETCLGKPWFETEIQDTVSKIKERGRTGDKMMLLCLLADSHYTVNGTWEDTARNIRRVAEAVSYDAIIHLGDLTDGMVSKVLTKKYVNKILGDLDECAKASADAPAVYEERANRQQHSTPVYITPGNHDSNYFRNGRNSFAAEEMRALYRLPSEEGLDYYIDCPEYSVRMVFINSFDDKAPVRYGYRNSQLVWLKKVLFEAPAGTKFLIFSHDAPLAKLDYWSYYIQNGEELLELLEECNAKEQYQVIGFFYGHTHADFVYNGASFPIISVGCAKLEYFTDKKPEGAVTQKREADTVSQDLWDSLLIDFEEQKLSLIRFGAGEDREVSFEKKSGRSEGCSAVLHSPRPMKIWAHRGASGHAPENTLPAFELAYRMGADGVELDVQLTKDGIPVVIHDERIDRVSNGTGWVKDFTLEELRRFDVNKNFPAYGRAEIPTLAEVLDLLKATGMTINLELKNSRIFYENLEEKVLKMVEEKGLEDHVIYSSFNHSSMCRIKERKPSAPAAFLYSDGIADIAEYAGRYRMDAVHPSVGNALYPGVVEACHAKKIKVHVWTVNEKTDFDRMRALGADAVITNYVEKGC